jgi:hypothetical protein
MKMDNKKLTTLIEIANKVVIDLKVSHGEACVSPWTMIEIIYLIVDLQKFGWRCKASSG